MIYKKVAIKLDFKEFPWSFKNNKYITIILISLKIAYNSNEEIGT